MKTKQWKKLYGHTISFVCPYCLKTVPLAEATKEHEPPKSRQKELGPSKILLVCKKCNNEKGALTLDEYREWKRLNAIRTGRELR
jgi:5-methylcytosine-specific restriction endonuclease McrA